MATVPAKPAVLPASGGAPHARLAAWGLYLIVFVSGGILMGVELAGSRPLAPGFGTSIFVWGSLIGLFMGAMALGYYCGGVLADHWPSFTALSTFLSLAGLYVFLIPYFGYDACRALAGAISNRMMGPLVASCVLFFVPAFLMAMVSPYAVKLSAASLAGLGGVAGRLYALSTVGSVTGTLLTTFVLIPELHVSNVLHGLGIALIVAALVSLIVFKTATGNYTRRDRHGAGALAVLALVCLECAWVFFPVQPHVPGGERLLYYTESAYHDIAVSETVLYERNRYDQEVNLLCQPPSVPRWLKFNENHESGIYPYRGEYLNAVNYSDLVHLAVIWAREPKRMLVVGGGGGILPAQFSKHYPCLEHVDVLELDEKVVWAAERYFEAGQPKVTFHVGDARLNLRHMAGQYDLIVLDAYSSGGQIPFHLLTWEFLRECRAQLAPQGVLVTNIIAALENDVPPQDRLADIFLAEIKTLHASAQEALGLAHPGPDETQPLFRQAYVFPRCYEDETALNRVQNSRNVIVIATQDEKPRSREAISKTAHDLVAGEKPWVKIDPHKFTDNADNFYGSYGDGGEDERPRRVQLFPQSPGELQKYGPPVPILVDDYAPVDTMYRPIMREEAVLHSR